jgi:DNA polymerase III epsilon subunit-like protein
MNKKFCVDFETTGLEKNSKIIEIACVKLHDTHETWFEMLVNPEEEIPSEVQALTGITDSMVKFAANEKTALELFIAFLTSDTDPITLICHNSSFDQRVLESACQRQGLVLPIIKWVCTLKMSRALPKWHKKSCTLQNCVKRIGGSFTFHRAMGDVRACMEVYKYLIHARTQQEKENQETPILEAKKNFKKVENNNNKEFHSTLLPPFIPPAVNEQQFDPNPCIAAAMCGNYYLDALAMTKTSGLCDSCSEALDYHYRSSSIQHCCCSNTSQINCIEKLVQSNAALTLLALSTHKDNKKLKRARE